MRERAVLMGGTLTVWSKVGAGTAVELCIPSRSAFVKTRKRGWLSRAFAGARLPDVLRHAHKRRGPPARPF
jgi:hypothetical protein